MALLRVIAEGQTPVLHGGGGTLCRALQDALAKTGPVTILLHGYKYKPGPGPHCPHDLIFSQAPDPDLKRVVSWPRHLGYGRDAPAPGIAVGFGWNARGAIKTAYATAASAAVALATLVQALDAIDPARPVHILAHSLGARVALQALHHLPESAVSRMILLAAAEFRGAAKSALESPAGHGTEVVHVTSRENDLYDFLLERLVRPSQREDCAMATKLHAANLRNILLDHTPTLAALHQLGYRIAPPQRRICHWSPYLRPGVFNLYRALLSGDLPMRQLDKVLPRPEGRRWQRLVPTLPSFLPLPIAPKASL